MNNTSKESKEILALSFFTILSIAILHFWALESFLYWLYWWFDLIMHFLGSFWAGITLVWVYFCSGLFKGTITHRKIFYISFIAVLVSGIIWEIYELYLWETFKEANFLMDTIIDVIMNLVGVFVAYRYTAYSLLEDDEK